MKSVMAVVMTDDPHKLARAAEVLGRASAGLALDDVDVFLRFGDNDEFEGGEGS